MIMEKQNKTNKSKKNEKEVSARVRSREEMKGLCRWGRENRKDERIRNDRRGCKYMEIRLEFVRSKYMGNR